MSFGSDAKEVVMHFLKRTEQRTTPTTIAKMINQVKSLLRNNYTKEEIIKTIDYIIDVKKVDMYSIGYINMAINDVIRDINKEEKKREVEEQIKLTKNNIPESIKGVTHEYESTERNRDKLSRPSAKSRLGEKYNFDMFEK